MTNQLDLITESMRLAEPGLVQYGETGLTISPEATDDQLISIGHRLMAVRSYLKWSIGSLLFEMARRRKDDSWVSSFCVAHNLDPKERREMMGVYEFYKGGDTPALSYEHHREAMWGVGNNGGARDRAVAYLRTAQEQGLSYTVLRRTIRLSTTTTVIEPTQPELADYSIVFDFMRYTRNQLPHLATYTPERARIVLADLGECSVQFIEQLKAIANHA